MHQLADAVRATWVNTRGLLGSGDRYRIDHVTKVIYLNGSLPLDIYYQSLAEAITEISRRVRGATVVPLFPHRDRIQDGKNTG